MNRAFWLALLLLAAVGLNLSGSGLREASAQGLAQEPAGAVPKDASIGEPGELGITPKMRPILPTITTEDPLRFALHFEKKDGPVVHSDPELVHQMLDRTATLATFEIAVKAPGGKWEMLKPEAKELPPRPTMLYSDGTFLLELAPQGVRLLQMSGAEEASLPWKWDHKLAAGQYQIAVRGTLKLSAQMRRVQEVGKPPMEFSATKTDAPFKTRPITITVTRADMRNQSLVELEKAAVEALKADKTVAAEKLTVEGIDALAIADENGNRVIRVKATIPQPKPMVDGGGGIIIGPVVAGGTGYWQYEITMTPDGKAAALARARKGFCLARGTKVRTHEGETAVEDLRPGQEVWSYDFEKRELGAATVLGIFPSSAFSTVVINRHLHATPDHPVYARRPQGEQGWIRAGQLRLGDMLFTDEGKTTEVTSVQTFSGQTDVFDVAVDGPHNFFAQGILVHNKSIAWTPQAFVPWYALWNRAPKE